MTQPTLIAGTDSFNSACRDVRSELRQHGCWSDRLSAVSVRQTLVGFAYGWQYYKGCGDIIIPKFSFVRLWGSWRGNTVPLRDVLRHEYGHAVADMHRSLVKGDGFRDAFGGAHDSQKWLEYDIDSHVSVYASLSICEDFAEVFMYYIKYKGRLPRVFSTPVIAMKWKYIETICQRLKGGE